MKVSINRLGDVLKKFLSIILLICMTISISAYAASDVSIIGVNDKVLDYEIGYEPIVFAGRICVPYTVFSKDVGISSIYSADRKILTMYDFNHIVTLDLASNTIQDENLTVYSGSAFFRGSVIYVPVQVVAEIFELNYSLLYSDTEIVRIYNDEAKLADEVFKTLVDATYANMLTSSNQPSGTVGGTTTTTNPSVRPPVITDESEESLTVKEIQPFFVSEISKETIDLFEEGQLTFFVDQNSFENTEVLRYTHIKNQSVGIFVPQDEQNIDEYISQINDEIFQCLGIKTRIIFTQNQESIDYLEEKGYIVVESDYDYYSSYQITNSSERELKLNLSTETYLEYFLNFCQDETIEITKIDEFNY